ncbi:MAG: DoxX family protein [Mucilaginibacter sp.]
MEKFNLEKIARIGLGAALVVAGIGHLTFARKDFQAQVPGWVPLKVDDTVIYSGIAEIALGSALILTPKNRRKPLGKITAIFFTAVFPGNIAQFVQHRSAFGLNSDKKRFARLFFQPLLIYWALKSTGNCPEKKQVR